MQTKPTLRCLLQGRPRCGAAKVDAIESMAAADRVSWLRHPIDAA